MKDMQMFTRQFIDQGRESLTHLRENLARLNRRVRVLIVDNDPDDVMMLQRELRPFDIDMEVAYTGKEAVDLLTRKAFDFLFLDIKLNGFSGLDVLRQMLSKAIKVPAIVLTGAYGEDSPQTQEAWKLGALFVIQKPLRQDQLSAIFGRP